MAQAVKPQTVAKWLAYIEALHPKSIDMGLTRVSAVATRLNLTLDCPVITVAGTNGKGSTCAMLAHLYQAAGYRVASYTSPHLIQYQERISVNQQLIADDDLCLAFETVETARQDTSLTYYEMGTLAALWHFMQLNQAQALDIVILEVGLGGRLDATNIIDADCAIVTNIDLDHMEYLGDTREKIAVEKAGVYRSQQISICGDASPPASMLAYAEHMQVSLKLATQHFSIHKVAEGWHYQDEAGELLIPEIGLKGDFQRYNAATALYAVRALDARLPVTKSVQAHALADLALTGRFQVLHESPKVILDVAHNPQAAQALRDNLAAMMTEEGQLHAVFSMLADKDIDQVVSLLAPVVNSWHVTALHHPRAANLPQLENILSEHVKATALQTHVDMTTALKTAYKNATNNDKIIVFGSFFTVAAALASWPHIVED